MPCNFPAKIGKFTYKRSCARISDYDPGICISVTPENPEKLQTTPCAINKGKS